METDIFDARGSGGKVRVLNFRPFLYIFVSTAIGIASMSVACFLTPLGVALAAVWAAVTSATLIYAIAGRDGVLIAASVVAIVVTVAAGARFAVTVNAEPALDEDRTYVISGRVTERHVYSDGEFKATLDDLTVNDTPLDGRISLTISEPGEEYGYVDCGYVIETEGRARYRDIVRSDGIDASGVRSGVTYNVYADAEDVREVTPGDAGFLESMRAALHDTLTSRMGADAGEIAYGMIAGDQYALDEEVREDYSRAGIGHVLSVSGLHIALISAALCKLLFAVGFPATRSVSSARRCWCCTSFSRAGARAPCVPS